MKDTVLPPSPTLTQIWCLENKYTTLRDKNLLCSALPLSLSLSHTHTHAHTHTRTHAHARTHARTHAHTHTQIRRLEDKYATLRDKNLRLQALCADLEAALS
jgi:hypothetical protein